MGTTAVMWKYGYDAADQLTRCSDACRRPVGDDPAAVCVRLRSGVEPDGEQIDNSVTLSIYDNLNRLTAQAPGGR